uniref:CCHC-type domain-containing protein n=1 Tax=Oreochromis niloticus TaxID=8128 RepID=A0A669F5W9_ORENI
MTREDPPPWPPGPLGQFPLIQAPNPDYGKIGETKQKENESASDFLDRLRPVFRQNSGLDYEEGPERPYQQQLKNAFLNGLLPSIRAHVEKHWVTMNTGNLADALQYAEHATRVLKKKEKGGVFTVDPETGFIAFAGGYQGPRRGQGQKNNRGRKRNAGYKGDRRDREDRDNRCYNCGKEGHFARGCRYKNDNQDKWLPREEGETEIFNIEQLPLGSEHKPTAIIHVNGQPMTMLCDTGACKTVLNKKPKNLKHSNDTLIVKSASGHTSVKSLTESLTLEHKDSGRSCKNQCIYDPSCPVNLLGRDALEKLKIGVVPGPEGMYAKTMLCEGLDPQVNELVVHEGEGVPSHYWTLDLPPLEPLQNIANRYLPGHSRKLNFSEYHNTLRFKQSPGPDRSYDQQVHRLGPQKTHPATSVLENKEIVLSNQLPRDSLPVSSRSCSQHPQHAGLLNDPRGFIKATQRRLNQSKTHQHLLKVSDKFRLWSSPTSSVRSVGGRVISGNTRDPTPLAEVYSLEATGVSGGREEENTHRNGDARQRTQDSTEGERRDGHRRRQYWTTGCQLTTVTTLCFMFVFSVFLTIAIPLNSFHIGGYQGDKWNEYDWYLSSTDWDQGWDTVFTYTGNDWTPYSEYWLCGQRAYFILPPGWTGTCAPIFISDHTFRMSAVNSSQTTRRRRDVSAVQPHDPIYGSDVPEEFKLWTTGQKVLHSLFPWVGTGKNILRIETLDYRFGLFLNASCKINNQQNEEIDALRITVMQHRVALDMILAEKGGLCILFNNTCCTYIPDNVHSSNMTDALRTLKQLRDAQQQDYVTNTEDWLTWLLSGSWKSLLIKGLVFVGVLLLLLCCFTSCILPCAQSMINKVVAVHVQAYLTLPMDKDDDKSP